MSNEYGLPDLNFYDTNYNSMQKPTWNGNKVSSINKNIYIPKTGDAVQSSYGWNGSNESNIVKSSPNEVPTWDGKTVGTNKPSSTLDTWNVGLNTLSTLGNLVSTWKQNNLALKAFNYNKKMSDKNFLMAKDAYQSRVNRGRNVTRQQLGETQRQVQVDQDKYNAKRDNRMKDV